MDRTIINKIVRLRMPSGSRSFNLFTDSDISFKNTPSVYHCLLQNPELNNLLVKTTLRQAGATQTARHDAGTGWRADLREQIMMCANMNEAVV